MMDKIEEQVSELSSGQENREKVKALSAEIVVHGTTEKPYYEIEYFDLSDRKYHTGYSSYDLNNVFRWRKECFEIVKEEKSDTISEQVKELRELAADMEKYVGLRPKPRILRESADTIQSLSAKLQVANMERSSEDCGGWVSCKERLPEDGVDVLVWFEYFRYGEYNRLFQTKGISYTFNGEWSGFVNGQSGWDQLRIISWQPLPEDYHES